MPVSRNSCGSPKSWSEAFDARSLMGVKTAVNELVSCVHLAKSGWFDCALAPDRRQDVMALAPRALTAERRATLMTGEGIGLI